MELEVIDRVKPRGSMTLRTYQNIPEYADMTPHDVLRHLRAPDSVRFNKNVICSEGLTILLSGLLWSSIEDQNANMGSPFTTTYVAPIYGAVGNGNGTVSAGGGTVSYTSTTLVDTSQAWTVNQWAAGNVTAGNVTATITSNTATTLTLSAAWSTTPTNGTGYFISQPTTGSGNVTTNVTDGNLVSEVARAVVTQAGYTAADQSGNGALQWLFLFPTPAATTTITEAGVFVNVPTATLPPPVNSGFILDHAAINPAITQTTSQLLTLSVTVAVG